MTTDRSEQGGPDGAPPSLHEAIAVFDHSASRTHPNGQTRAWAVIREHLSSHQQAVEALRAEVELLRGVVAKFRDEPPVMLAAAVASVLTKRAESAEARLARVAAVLADLRGRLTPSADFLADQIAAAIAPQDDTPPAARRGEE